MKKTVLNIICYFLLSSVCFGNEVLVEITDLVDKGKDPYTNKTICKIQYEVTNQSSGTIYNLRVNFTAWTDRKERLKGVGALGIFYSDTALPINQKITLESGEIRGSECKYIDLLEISEVPVYACNIRNLPEEADCERVVNVKSALSQLKIQKLY